MTTPFADRQQEWMPKASTRSEGGMSNRLLAAILLVVIAGILALEVTASLKTSHRVVLSSLATASYLGGLLLLVPGGTKFKSLFELRLGAWVLAYGVIAFGLSTLTILGPQYGTARAVSVERVPETLFLICIAFTALTAGYGFGGLRLFVSPVENFVKILGRARSQSLRPAVTLYGVFFLGIGADLLSALLEGRLGYLGDATLVTSASAQWYVQPLTIISQLKILGILGITLRAYSDKRARPLLTLMLPVGIALLIGLLSGIKESFLEVFLAVVVGYAVTKGRVHMSGLALLAVVFALVVTPFVTQLREDVRSSTGSLGVSEAVQLGGVQLISADGYLSNVDSKESSLQALTRLRLADNLNIISEKTPSIIPYLSIDELLTAPFSGAIPRAIWPDKPVRLTGYDFFVTYYGGQGQSSSAVTLQGSLFMYGGASILILGMFLVGVALRAIDEGIRARWNLHGTVLFVILAPIVVKQELDVSSFLAGFIVLLLTWWIGWTMLFPRHSTRPADVDANFRARGGVNVSE